MVVRAWTKSLNIGWWLLDTVCTQSIVVLFRVEVETKYSVGYFLYPIYVTFSSQHPLAIVEMLKEFKACYGDNE